MPERPRVLHLAPDPSVGGGMAAALRALLSSPLAESYELEVVPTYRTRGRSASPTTTATGPRALLQIGVFTRALLRLIVWSLRGRGRVVHVHATVRGSSYRKAVCVRTARLMRRRVVLHVHSGAGDIAAFRSGAGRLGLALFRSAFRRADAVLAVSAASAEALREAGVEEEIEVVPNPAPRVEAFERVPPAGGGIRAAYLGGFANRAKGGDILVKALGPALIREPRLRVTLAGPGDLPEGGAGLGGGDSTPAWAGWLDDAARDELLREAEIFVMPSRSEGMPMALLEAMAYGTAVIATAAGGIPELIEDGVDGVLVPAEDADALADALCALAADPERRVRLGAAARSRAEQLDVVEVASRLARIYARIG